MLKITESTLFFFFNDNTLDRNKLCSKSFIALWLLLNLQVLSQAEAQIPKPL